MIYRPALGLPNREDFIDVLSRSGRDTRSLLQGLILDFSAMGLRPWGAGGREAWDCITGWRRWAGPGAELVP